MGICCSVSCIFCTSPSTLKIFMQAQNCEVFCGTKFRSQKTCMGRAISNTKSAVQGPVEYCTRRLLLRAPTQNASVTCRHRCSALESVPMHSVRGTLSSLRSSIRQRTLPPPLPVLPSKALFLGSNAFSLYASSERSRLCAASPPCAACGDTLAFLKSQRAGAPRC